MLKTTEAITYDNIHHAHSEELTSFWDKRQETTHNLMNEIVVIRNNLKKLISNRDSVINSISDEERHFVSNTINELTTSFTELDNLIDNLQKVTHNYDNELSKYLNLVNDDTNSLTQTETRDLISHEKEVLTCPHCSISFTYHNGIKKCPSCDSYI